MKKVILIIYLITAVYTPLLFSQNSFSINSKINDYINLKDYQFILIDTTGHITIDDIVGQNNNSQFKKYSPLSPLKSSHTYWVKIEFENYSESDEFLITTSIDWLVAEMYVQYQSDDIKTFIAGTNSKRPDYGFEHYNYFDVNFFRKEKLSIYYKLRFSSTNPKKIEFKIIGKEQYLKSLNTFKLYYISGLAIIVAMIFYNLFIFFITRQKEYICYVIFLTGILGAFGIFLFYNLFPKYSFFLIAEQSFYTLAVVGFTLFFKKYLSVKTYFKKVYKLLNVSLIITVIVFILHEINVLTSEEYPFFTQNIWLFAIAGVLFFVFAMNVNAVIRKIRPSYYLLIAVSISIAGGLYSILTETKVISLSSQSEAKQVLLIAQVLQVILISMAIGDKILKLQQERTRSLLNNLKFQRSVNVKLEQKVTERTSEITRKNAMLEQQKEEILAQRDEIEMQKKHVIDQRDKIASQKKGITDSIQYAKRIQTAALPSDDYIKSIFDDYFILYRPKDIVSGDFYWVKKIKEYLIFIAADCTGHGVPGAFMSMLGISLLNEIIQKEEITQANHALNELRKHIIESLRQKEKSNIDETRDGMDIAFCALNTKTNTLQFSGAFNPLYLIRNNELTRIKGDNVPVGIHFEERPFTNHEIKLEPNDAIYIFSDGYCDQVGGENKKKFMTRHFNDLLLEINQKPMAEQYAILTETLDKWQNGFDQTDDILVIGIRFH